MPVSQPHTYSLVPYQSPSARATQAAGTAATGFLIALGLAIIPICIAFLQAGAFNRTALIAMATAVGIAALSVVTTYLVKLQQARGSDIPPTVTPGNLPAVTPGTEVQGELIALPALPMVDPVLLVNLVEDVLRKYLNAPPSPTTPRPEQSSDHVAATVQRDAGGRFAGHRLAPPEEEP